MATTNKTMVTAMKMKSTLIIMIFTLEGVDHLSSDYLRLPLLQSKGLFAQIISLLLYF